MESDEPEISRFSDQLNLEIAQAHFQSSLPDGWVMTSSKSQGGRTYYFNVASGESRWDHPLLPDEDCQQERRLESVEENSRDVTDDSIMPPRERPISHVPTDPPLCENCRKLELTFFDPNCAGCHAILIDINTTIPQLFAVMRQWVPQVQQNIELFIKEILRRGANVNDRDGLTDMALIHYACKAGAVGVGDVAAASSVVSSLMAKGADISQKCRWTDMLPLHYAAFFDAAAILKVLLKASKARDVDIRCKEFENGSSLHIAASNLCLEAARCLEVFHVMFISDTYKDVKSYVKFLDTLLGDLKEPIYLYERVRYNDPGVVLQHGANAFIKDKQNRIPVECIPDMSAYDPDSEPSLIAAKLSRLLSDAEPPPSPQILTEQENESPMSLANLGLKIGDRVLLSGTKSGVLRFYGTTEFASGDWAGLELDEPVGKNDGSVGGVAYFTCKPKHGIFAPLAKITKNDTPKPLTTPRTVSTSRRSVNGASQSGTTSQLISKSNSRSSSRPSSRPSSCSSSRTTSPVPTSHDGEQEVRDIEVGERVIVAGQKTGIVRFSGSTQFASGWWFGVELDQPVGKNDGSVSGVRYFTCKPRFGVFAPVAKVERANGINGEVFSVPSAPTRKNLHGSHQSLHSSGSRGSRGSLSDVSQTDSNPELKKSSLGETKGSSIPDSQRRGSASSHSDRRGSLTTSVNKSKKNSAEFRLTEGMSVLVHSELGVVRYIGTAEFADGIWLGVEMRKPVGKNDGTVNGKRYFTCKPNYGLMVRPKSASCRGINCSKLIEDLAAA